MFLTNLLVFIHGKDSETSQTVSEQKTSIAALVKGLESIEIISVDGNAPEGCGAFVVSEQCNVYTLVKVPSFPLPRSESTTNQKQGRVNVDVEVEKARKKIAKTTEFRKRLEKARAVPDYQTKVKAAVQEADKQKLNELAAEEKTLQELIGKFEGLRA